MLQSFVKLLAISVGALTLAVFAVFFVRWMGLQQVFKAPPHPWFEKASWNILTPSREALCRRENVEKLVPNGDWILGVTVERRKDAWVIPCPEQPWPIKDFLAAHPHPDWLIRVNSHDTWGLDELLADLQSFEKDRHFGISTDAQKVSIYLRKKAPEMLFAADSGSLLRFQLFESLWIETAMDFWPDFVIVDFGKDFHLDARGATELQRRQKRIIWNKSGPESATPPPQVNIQGIMSANPQ